MDQVRQIADEIEQYMFERGEYEYIGDDRIRWIDDGGNRSITTRNLCNTIITNANQLFDYLEREIATASDEDAETVIGLLQRLQLVAVIVKEDM